MFRFDGPENFDSVVSFKLVEGDISKNLHDDEGGLSTTEIGKDKNYKIWNIINIFFNEFIVLIVIGVLVLIILIVICIVKAKGKNKKAKKNDDY